MNPLPHLYPLLFLLLFSSLEGRADIIEYPNKIEFVCKDNSCQRSSKTTARFLSFKRGSVSLPYAKACPGPGYQIEGHGSYVSLYNFIELSQRTDFKVSPHKDYAVVWSSSCQRPCAAAESEWTCASHATTLDINGNVLGDIEGTFEEVLFHHHLPYIFFVHRGVGDMIPTAEVYDIKGTYIGKIQDYKDSFLDSLKL